MPDLFMADSSSRRRRCWIEPTTMLPPTVRSKTRALRFKCFDRRFPVLYSGNAQQTLAPWCVPNFSAIGVGRPVRSVFQRWKTTGR